MLIYLLKSSACLAIFMLFYKLCLEKTSAHTFKRFYLIAVIIISISIPFITFTEYVETESLNLASNTEFNNIILTNNNESISFKGYLPAILGSIYILGVILFSFRFFKNLYHLFQKIKSNPKFKKQKYINVLLLDLIHPHTFFNYIFLNKTKYEHNLIPSEVLLHEQTHAKQKHALDILFIEVLQILFWFNPLLYFIKKDIKLNHEFLADQAVINNGFNTKKYQQLLLAFSSNAADNSLANAINYSLIKKRFTVMKTKTSKTTLRLRSLIILPLLAILIYSFSGKVIIENNSIDNKIISSQQKATAKQIAEYNTIAKKYNAQPENKRVIKLKDIKRLEYLYSLMSIAQKENAEPFPNCPPPPPPPPLPVTKTNSEMSPEFLKTKKEFEEKGNKYGKAVSLYLKEKKGNQSEIKVMYTEVMELYKKYNDLANKENLLAPPPPPPAPKEQDAPEINDVPPPPPPKLPLDYVIDMAKKGAKFYYKGKEISSDKAIDLTKKNKDLNISTKTKNGLSTVKIQTEPITF